MGMAELLLLAVGLSADAFSASVCEGIRMKKINYNALLTALFFGIFQAGMPIIGYLAGRHFAEVTAKYDHWIAFILLGIIGSKMILESYNTDNSSINNTYYFNIKDIVILSVATSIDAMAVGIVFSAQKVNIIFSVCVIGLVTLMLSFCGVVIGNKFGKKYGNKAEIFGGMVLVFIGVKLLLQDIL